MVAWPLTLPQTPSAQDFSDTLPDNAIRTGMEVGKPKRRRRTIATEEPLTGSMKMTTAQWYIVKNFFQNTVGEVLPFDFPEPGNPGNTLSVIFTGPPGRLQWQPGVWTVKLGFMVQP